MYTSFRYELSLRSDFDVTPIFGGQELANSMCYSANLTAPIIGLTIQSTIGVRFLQ